MGIRIIIDNRKTQPAPPMRATRVYSLIKVTAKNSPDAIKDILV
jgi:hypothetical protein